MNKQFLVLIYGEVFIKLILYELTIKLNKFINNTIFK